MAMIATSWEVCWLHQSKYHHQAHLDLVPENTHVGSHVAAIPTLAVWRQQLWSGEVVHLQPPAVQTSAQLYGGIILPKSSPALMGQSTQPLSGTVITSAHCTVIT